MDRHFRHERKIKTFFLNFFFQEDILGLIEAVNSQISVPNYFLDNPSKGKGFPSLSEEDSLSFCKKKKIENNVSDILIFVIFFLFKNFKINGCLSIVLQ